MRELNLLSRYPKGKRNTQLRLDKKAENKILASQFGREYFDGTREQGYGGYVYDGRWIPIAQDIVAEYGLRPGDRVLDVGCAKGFLVKDLMNVLPGLEVFGLDVSDYALMNCENEVIGRLHRGSASALPFPDSSFDLVLSINTIHNLDVSGCLKALREIKRVSKRHCFVQVDSYRSEDERSAFLDWVLTAKTHGTPDFWETLFLEADYTGDYFWTFV